MRVFVAGAGGAVGRRLVPQLIARGHDVVATATSQAKTEALRALGAETVVMDGLDAGSVGEAVARSEPEAVVHEMTALAGSLDLRRFDEGFALTNELRTKGTDHLLAASDAIGVPRFVAQSFAGWPNARSGGLVKSEADELDPSPPRAQRESLAAIRYLERSVVDDGGVVLRYGSLYGPGTSLADEYPALIRRRKLPVVGGGSGVWSFVHVDDAASATVAAVEYGAPGIYNIVDDEPAPVREWLPYLAECLGAPPPRRVPAWLARFAVGEVGVSLMTQVRGSSNAKARRELGWEPRFPSWRQGFHDTPAARAVTEAAPVSSLE
jgi:nucleoside-diphosphate-sugar epimerase